MLTSSVIKFNALTIFVHNIILEPNRKISTEHYRMSVNFYYLTAHKSRHFTSRKIFLPFRERARACIERTHKDIYVQETHIRETD